VREKKQQFDLTTMVYGKVPPQARELEEAVLGACQLERDAFDLANEIVKPESFYVDANKIIFTAMVELRKNNQPVDNLTLIEQLKKMGQLDYVGGPYYVTKLTSNVTSSANIERHSRIVQDKFIQREMIRISGETINSAYEDSVELSELISTHEKQFTELTTSPNTNFIANDEALITALQRIEKLRHNDTHMTGVASGFNALDRLTHGWQDTDLIILAARPSVGKSALALQLTRNAALDDVPVGVFTLEMSVGQCTNRNISAESEIWLDMIISGRLTDVHMKQIYEKAITKLAKAKIFYDDTAALNIYELRARCRRMKRKQNVGLIIVDYLQLMSGSKDNKGNREQQISEISRGLKQIAKELHVPVIALSQLSRAPETRKGESKMPQLSDLRESGAIEQDADTVIFIYRPEYYDINANELGESTRGETHLKIAKHRNGALDTIKLRANLSIQKFYDWDGLDDVKKTLGNERWKPVSDIYSNGKDDLI
jgi:replicative DNA helicase